MLLLGGSALAEDNLHGNDVECDHIIPSGSELQYIVLEMDDPDYLNKHICGKCNEKVEHEWIYKGLFLRKHECTGCTIVEWSCVWDANGVCKAMGNGCDKCQHLNYTFDGANHKCLACNREYGADEHVFDTDGKCRAKSCTAKCSHAYSEKNPGYCTVCGMKHDCEALKLWSSTTGKCICYTPHNCVQ